MICFYIYHEMTFAICANAIMISNAGRISKFYSLRLCRVTSGRGSITFYVNETI